MRQPLFPSNAVDDQRPKVDVKLLAVPIAFALLAALGTYYLVNAYLLHQARQNVRDILLSHRGLHLYIQRTMHEEFYRARTNQEISMAYYAPEILSSSFMVRVLHGYYNEERQRAGLPPVYYKMAADNPRNPVNQTDAAEAKLLEYFRDHPEVREYSEVEKIDGKTCLVFAMPFLRTEERCLVCHGKREEAPQGLQARYPQAGGYGEALGELRAIESLRIPIEEEKLTAMIGTLAALAGFGAVGGLLVFNGMLNRTVRSRTAELASRERTVRRLLDAAESVPFEYMPETGRYTYVGPQFREIFGAEPSVLRTGEDWEAMVHPSDRETTLRACREATLRGEDHDCLLKIVAFDGRLKLIHQTVNIVQEAGKPLQVVGFLHDVTEQRRSEALQGTRLAIAESAVELGMDGVILRLVDEVERLTASRVGFFHFVNDTQRKIVLQAWSTNTPAAFRVEEKGACLPMDSAGAWSECLAQRTTLVRNEAAPYERDARPGAPLHRELLHPIVHDGNPVALIGVGNKDAEYDALDVALVGQLAGLVTEAIMRKRAEEEKVRLRVQLIQAQKLESIGRLAGGVAHDFNNVLAAMMMQLSFLQQKPDFDLETREALVELTTEAQRAASLTRQLLMFSRRGGRKDLRRNGSAALVPGAGVPPRPARGSRRRAPPPSPILRGVNLLIEHRWAER